MEANHRLKKTSAVATAMPRRSFVQFGALFCFGGFGASCMEERGRNMVVGEGAQALTESEREIARAYFERSPRAKELVSWLSEEGLVADWGRASLYEIPSDGAVVAEHGLHAGHGIAAAAAVGGGEYAFPPISSTSMGPLLAVVPFRIDMSTDGRPRGGGTLLIRECGDAFAMLWGERRRRA